MDELLLSGDFQLTEEQREMADALESHESIMARIGHRPDVLSGLDEDEIQRLMRVVQPYADAGSDNAQRVLSLCRYHLWAAIRPVDCPDCISGFVTTHEGQQLCPTCVEGHVPAAIVSSLRGLEPQGYRKSPNAEESAWNLTLEDER